MAVATCMKIMPTKQATLTEAMIEESGGDVSLAPMPLPTDREELL